MKKIKFVKAYANVPEGTYIESENGNVFTYKNVTGENSEDYSFESSYTISFTKGEVNRLIQRGVIVECVTPDEYEDQLGKAIINTDATIDRLKYLERANKRLDSLLKRYNDRKQELVEKLDKMDDSLTLESIDTMNRIYVCESIIKALEYVQYSNTRAKA